MPTYSPLISVIERSQPQQIELDSHADTTLFGRNFLILSYTGRECDVMPYTDTYKSVKGVPMVTAATAWTCQDSGQTYLMVTHTLFGIHPAPLLFCSL